MSEEVKLSKSAKDKEKQAQDEAKLKTLETVLGKIEKTYGKGAVMNMAARPTTDVNVIPTGSINLDHALGVGGYPRGRIIEIYGPESSGKTTLAIHAIAEVQKQGGKAIIMTLSTPSTPPMPKRWASIWTASISLSRQRGAGARYR